MKRKQFVILCWILVCVMKTGPAFARIRDLTLDFAEPGQPADLSENLYKANSSDPWNGFFAQLSGFDQVRTWGLSLQGANPLQKNESNPLAPASVQKLVTTAAAFRHLGSGARFANSFEANFDPSTKDAFNVLFKVSGDPTWGHESFETAQSRLQKVINELKAQGVKRVSGQISVVPVHPELDQIQVLNAWPKRWTLQCMATQPTSFMFHGNCGEILVQSLSSAKWITPGVDVPIQLKIFKASANSLSISANLDTYGRIQSYRITGGFAKPTSTFYDSLQSASLSALPVHQSLAWLEKLFIEALNENGIAYSTDTEHLPQNSAAALPLFVDLSSLPLIDILKIAVSQSINSILDRTYFETAFHESTPVASDPSFSILREVVGNEDMIQGVQILDGSGLAANDRMRADLLKAFLGHLEDQPYFSDLLSTLAVAGISGTLATRLTGPLTNGKVFAKTGTIDGVYNLAGYFQTPDKRYEPFAILSESALTAAQVRGMIDKIATEFALINTPGAELKLR